MNAPETITTKRIRLGQLVIERSVAEKICFHHEDTKPRLKAGRRHNEANMLAIAAHRLTQQRLFDSWKNLQAEELALAKEIIAEEKA